MKILVVDDSKAMRMIVMRTIRQAGFQGSQIEEASNGKEAMEKATSFAPDLIVSDWNMPEMTGIELLQGLKASGCTAKFGFVTSRNTPEMRAEAHEHGANFFLAKPFTVEDFKEKLGDALS